MKEFSPEEIKTGVIECVSQSLATSPTSVTIESRLLSDLNADSLDFMDIMFSLEQKFGIRLQKEDFNLLSKMGVNQATDTVGGVLSVGAKEKLQYVLPMLPIEETIAIKDLGSFISVETLIILVTDLLKDLKLRAVTPGHKI